MYAILDVETTGLSAAGEKITEIAIYIPPAKGEPSLPLGLFRLVQPS